MQAVSRREFAAVLAAAVSARAAVNTVDSTLRDGIARRKIPAVAGMAATANKTIYTGAFGIRETSGPPVRNDSIFAIASMTKAITTTAALQFVEQGKVKLESPVAEYLPKLKDPLVLTGFSQSGEPILRPAKTPITLKHLLTHTSGLCYSIWDDLAFQYSEKVKDPPSPGPLMFEPGARWQYGQGIDWAGRLVETLSGMTLEEYFQAKILRPLEMKDTSYILPASKFDRLVTNWRRREDGVLKQEERKQPSPPKSFNGGGGLYSTTSDYTLFLQMILNRGTGVNGARILAPETVAGMQTNQIGKLTAGKMKSYGREYSSDVDIQPGFEEKWGLGFLINTTAYAGGRSAGSLAWAGIDNTFYWIDPKRGVCGVLMMQFLPFVDKEAVGLLNDFERAVYSSLSA